MPATLSLRAAVLSVLIAAAPAVAGEVETARMTWPEIRDAIAAGATTIIIPTGGTEQNGPHMVTGKHNTIVAETARRIAAKLGDALVAPVLAYVPEGDIATREGHMAYPGTISIPPDIFGHVLESAAQSFKIHGFKTIVFLGDSGPNQAPQVVVARVLSQAWRAEGVRVLSAEAYYGNNGQVEFLKSQGETDAAIGVHASIRDTSELMAIAPDGIRLDRRAADKDGVSGDPTRATAGIGAKLLDLKVAAAVNEIQAARKAPPVTAPLPSAVPGEGILSRLWRMITG